MSKTTSLLELFENNELKISVLYKRYAINLPKHKDFWNQLSAEEVGHAQELASQKKSSPANCFQESKFARGVIQYVNDFIEQSLIEAKNKKISHQAAINTALRIEQSLLEKKCFELFVPSQLSLKKLLKKLNRETDQHIKRLKKELKKQP